MRLVLRRLAKFFWGILALLVVLQLILNGFEGVSGMAGNSGGLLNVNKHEVWEFFILTRICESLRLFDNISMVTIV